MSDIVQGSKEWHQARLGKVTASRVSDALAKTKSGWSRSRANYMAELLCERLTGQWEEGFISSDMVRGQELEMEARALYEFERGVTVTEVGFIDHPKIPMSGCSPDGLIAEDGGMEIKCLKSGNHLECLLNNKVPPQYLKQINWNMACTKREWWDFTAYHPAFPPECQLFVRRTFRNEDAILQLEEGVREFLKELDAGVQAIKEQMQQPLMMAG